MIDSNSCNCRINHDRCYAVSCRATAWSYHNGYCHSLGLSGCWDHVLRALLQLFRYQAKDTFSWATTDNTQHDYGTICIGSAPS